MKSILYENRLKIFAGFMLMFVFSTAYIYNSYSFIGKSYKEKDKNYMSVLYELYKKDYLKEGTFKNIYLQNPYYVDNKEMINEMAKSTPLMTDLDKDKKKISKYSLIIKHYPQSPISDKEIANLVFDLGSKDYKVYFKEENQILIGRLFDKSFIYIERAVDADKYESTISTFFKFLVIFSGINLILLFYLLHGIKSSSDERSFMHTHYEQLQEDTRKIAFEDRLTGAASRLKFDESLKDLIHISSRFEEHKFCLIILDIDNFKSVNDTYGHDYGDVVLIEVAKVIKNNIRQSDTFARWGGEEFVILLPLVELESAIVFTEKIRELICKIKFEKLDRITCSFGLVEFDINDDEKTILKRADEYLYKAKKSGKNKVVYE